MLTNVKYFIGVKNLVTDNNRLPGLHYIRNNVWLGGQENK